MSLISQENFDKLSDRVAKQAGIVIKSVYDGIEIVETPEEYNFYPVLHDEAVNGPNGTITGNPSLEINTLSAANNADSAWTETTAPTLVSNMLSSLSTWYSWISGLNTHFAAEGLSGGLNSYLEELENDGSDLGPDPISGTVETQGATFPSLNQGRRVSEYFNDVYKKVVSTGLRARNVFKEGEVELVDVEIISGSLTWTKNSDYPNGFGSNAVNVNAGSGNWAACRWGVKVVESPTEEIILNIDATKPNTADIASYGAPSSTPTNVNVTIPSLTDVGTIIPIGDELGEYETTPADERYLDICCVNLGNSPSSSATFTIVNIEEKDLDAYTF